MKIDKTIQLKIFIFTAVKNRCILHGCVFVTVILFVFRAVMRVSINGGTAQSVGPPGFGRLNDIHVHKTGFGPSGETTFYALYVKKLL